jgi:phosphatidylglycerophosphate synthase
LTGLRTLPSLLSLGFAGIVRWNVILPLLLLSFLISYIRSRIELAAQNKISAAVGLIERTERLLTVFLGLFLYMLFPDFSVAGFNIAEVAFLVLTVLSAYTVGQRVQFAYKKL